MKRFVISIAAVAMLSGLAETAEAQWVRRYRPVYRRYYRPVVVAPTPVTRVYRRPMVVYQPTTRFYTRRRPFLGGYSVRPSRVYRRTVVW